MQSKLELAIDMTKEIKRGRGRPKLQPVSAEELRMQALAGIKQTADLRLKRGEIDVPTFVEEIEAVTGKHKFTRKEMDEMREKVDLIYNEYIKEEWEEEEQYRAPFIDTLRAAAIEGGIASTGMMNREEWYLAHGVRKEGTKRRGPAPNKKKTVWDLTPGDKGTADRPSEPIDVDAMERQLEAQMMEEYIKQQAEEPQMQRGKRVRRDDIAQLKRASTKSFWI